MLQFQIRKRSNNEKVKPEIAVRMALPLEKYLFGNGKEWTNIIPFPSQHINRGNFCYRNVCLQKRTEGSFTIDYSSFETWNLFV